MTQHWLNTLHYTVYINSNTHARGIGKLGNMGSELNRRFTAPGGGRRRLCELAGHALPMAHEWLFVLLRRATLRIKGTSYPLYEPLGQCFTWGQLKGTTGGKDVILSGWKLLWYGKKVVRRYPREGVCMPCMNPSPTSSKTDRAEKTCCLYLSQMDRTHPWAMLSLYFPRWGSASGFRHGLCQGSAAIVPV